MNELHNYEAGHFDALCTTAPDPQKTLMSEHSEFAPATNAKLRSTYRTLDNHMTLKYNSIHAEFEWLRKDVHEIKTAMIDHIGLQLRSIVSHLDSQGVSHVIFFIGSY